MTEKEEFEDEFDSKQCMGDCRSFTDSQSRRF